MTNQEKLKQQDAYRELVDECAWCNKQVHQDEWALKNAIQDLEDSKRRLKEEEEELSEFRKKNTRYLIPLPY